MAAKNAMKSESKPKPESEWDDNDIFEDLIGHRPMIYTEKGKHNSRLSMTSISRRAWTTAMK